MKKANLQQATYGNTTQTENITVVTSFTVDGSNKLIKAEITAITEEIPGHPIHLANLTLYGSAEGNDAILNALAEIQADIAGQK